MAARDRGGRALRLRRAVAGLPVLAQGGRDRLRRVGSRRHAPVSPNCAARSTEPAIPLLAAPALAPSFRRLLDEYTDHYLRVYSAIAGASGRPVVVDSSKHASLAFCLRWRTEWTCGWFMSCGTAAPSHFPGPGG